MSSLMQQRNRTEIKKRALFFATGIGGLVLFFAGYSFIGISVFASGIYFGWKWFKYRAKNGMRF